MLLSKSHGKSFSVDFSLMIFSLVLVALQDTVRERLFKPHCREQRKSEEVNKTGVDFEIQ
jgi:hypothetical protein